MNLRDCRSIKSSLLYSNRFLIVQQPVAAVSFFGPDILLRAAFTSPSLDHVAAGADIPSGIRRVDLGSGNSKDDAGEWADSMVSSVA